MKNSNIKSFDESYKNNDILQKDFNNVTINRYTDIIFLFYQSLGSDKHPLSIVDLCCGYGKPTFELYQSLVAKNVEIDKMIGYDISAVMISQAKDEYKEYQKLEFKEKNVELLDDKNKYDIAISLFGLHWMDDVGEIASKIFDSLNTPGKLMFFVPLEKMDLYEFRKKFILESKWSEYFIDMKELKPFIENEKFYLEAFEKFFKCENEKAEVVQKNYTKDEFIKFLSSWMQEVRYLCKDEKDQETKQILSQTYVKELVDSIPNLINGNVVKNSMNSDIVFMEHVFSYEGTKLNIDIMGGDL